MTRFRPGVVFLALTLALAPARMSADWEVVEYDGQKDWVRHDFVGWVRVEQPAKPAKYARGTAAVTLKVIEKLAGDETGPTFTLEYEAATAKKGGEEPAGKHQWHEDLAAHGEYFVFLERLGPGVYWCGEQRAFPIRNGRIFALPGAYGVLVNGETSPQVHELFDRARLMLPAFRVRTGRPGFAPPLVEKGKPVETPQQGYERIRAVLQGGNQGELDRLIHSPDGAPPKGLRALLQQEREHLASWPVQWQAVLEDKAVVVLGPPGQPASTLYLMRRGARWLLLNTLPETEIGRDQVNQLLTESQFAILTAALEREYRAR
jgi:hypothetical protein